MIKDLNKFILRKYMKSDRITDAVIANYIALHGADGKGGRVINCNIPLEYRFTMLHNSPAKDDQEEIYKKLEVYVDSFKKQFNDTEVHNTKGQIKSVYLWSENSGTGKTTTACALANEFLAINYLGSLKRGLQPDETPVYFLDLNELQDLYNRFNRSGISSSISEEASLEYYERIEKAKKAKLVVFDDVGVRSASEAFRGDLHSLINYRVVNQLPNIYTANHPITELANVYDNRLYDRIKDLTLTLHFEGESNRGVRR